MATDKTSQTKLVSQARARALTFLKGARIAGPQAYAGYPYHPGAETSLEATAWALIALRDDKAAANEGLKYLAAAQNSSDGGWSTRPGVGHSDWTTGPVLLAMRLLFARHGGDSAVKKALAGGQSHLLDSRVEFYGPTARLLLLFSKGPAGLEYGRGWPWDPKCFHWLEPTAYCLMALKLPSLPDSEDHRAVIKFADQFILEHACRGGGWNHGNDLSLGAFLPPYRLTTAEALLALQGPTFLTGKDLSVRAEKIKSGLQFLKTKSEEDSSSLSLATSILALDAYGESFAAEQNYLLNRQAADGSFGLTVMSTALAAIALEAGDGSLILKTGGKIDG